MQMSKHTNITGVQKKKSVTYCGSRKDSWKYVKKVQWTKDVKRVVADIKASENMG